MNKQERKLKGLNKWRKRKLQLGLTGAHCAYKTSGKPCSCFVCSTHKYKHNGQNKKAMNDLKFYFI